MKVQSNYNYSNYDKPAFKAGLSSNAATKEIIDIMTIHHDYGKQYMEALRSNLERIPTKDIFSISRFMPSSSINNKSGYMVTNETNGAAVKFFDEAIENCKTKFYGDKLHTQNLAEAIYSTIMKNIKKLLSDTSALEGVEFIKPDLSGLSTEDIKQLFKIISNSKMPKDMRKHALKILEANQNSDYLSLETKNQIGITLKMYGGKKL